MSTLNEFVDSYLEKGFGSMNKNDFEVAIFNYLITERSEFYRKSNYEISILLRIPETKVKRLRYEAALKNKDLSEDKLKNGVVELLEKAKIREDGKKIIFQVEHILLKTYISSLLKKHGCACDGSFSPEIVAINADDYPYLLEEIYPKEYEELKKQLRNSKAFKTMGDFFKHLSKDLFGETGEFICDLTLNGAKKLISKFNTK